MKVWIVFGHEHYEGDDILAVLENEYEAKEFIHDYRDAADRSTHDHSATYFRPYDDYLTQEWEVGQTILKLRAKQQ